MIGFFKLRKMHVIESAQVRHAVAVRSTLLRDRSLDAQIRQRFEFSVVNATTQLRRERAGCLAKIGCGCSKFLDSSTGEVSPKVDGNANPVFVDKKSRFISDDLWNDYFVLVTKHRPTAAAVGVNDGTRVKQD